MSEKTIRIISNSDKPDNLIKEEIKLEKECKELEKNMPAFLRHYFVYLKQSVSLKTRIDYLRDINFFFSYLVNELNLHSDTIDFPLSKFIEITSKDINIFLGEYCNRYIKETEKSILIYENSNRTIARKKSSITNMYKYLYRDETIKVNVVDKLNPIKFKKTTPDEIKYLNQGEIAILLDAVSFGYGLTDKEKGYWKKTKNRDRCIIVLFLTYGLRLSEIRQLNISSFNYLRNEFTIYRKRDKVSTMPLNNSVLKVLNEYIKFERPKNKEEDALFLSLQGNRMDVKSIRNMIKKYTSISQGTSRSKGYSPHKLRATTATSLIQEGYSIYDVQNLLDHENITTTQLYASFKKGAKEELTKNNEIIDKFSLG